MKTSSLPTIVKTRNSVTLSLNLINKRKLLNMLPHEDLLISEAAEPTFQWTRPFQE